MTQRDFTLKWLLYVLALTPLLLLEVYVLPWFPIFGIIPTLLPIAAVTVAVLEGQIAGAGFGLFVGILVDALIPGVPGFATFGMALLGLLSGSAAQYSIRQNMLGCMICSAAGLGIIALIRVVAGLLQGVAGLWPLLTVAIPEAVISMLFAPLIYGLFRWVFLRVPQASLL